MARSCRADGNKLQGPGPESGSLWGFNQVRFGGLGVYRGLGSPVKGSIRVPVWREGGHALGLSEPSWVPERQGHDMIARNEEVSVPERVWGTQNLLHQR